MVIVLAACGGDSSGGSHPDAKSTVDAFASECGHPGDTGNDKGVGKFCQVLSDCTGNMSATLCSVLGDTSTHFCTTTCSSTGSADQCGTDATCTCNDSNQCGCTPNACLN
ncbi:MAG: hypothetical protein QM831_06975 [Kofleriaceae bacterium]